jgi:hypothetical protein
MPILPLDYCEPLASTLGVMHYPGTDDESQNKARTYTARFLSEPIKQAEAAGHTVPREILLPIAMEAGNSLSDLEDRSWGGMAIGDLFVTLWALFNTDPSLTSWNNAIAIAERLARRARERTARTKLWSARKEFLTVAHLWAAWMIRGGLFSQPEVGYTGYDDFQSFLAEAEILRDWGQTWKPSRKNSSPLLPADVWRVPDGWSPQDRKADWPNTGNLRISTMPEEIMTKLKKRGRPRKAA